VGTRIQNIIRSFKERLSNLFLGECTSNIIILAHRLIFIIKAIILEVLNDIVEEFLSKYF
jgi:hypothetical protein